VRHLPLVCCRAGWRVEMHLVDSPSTCARVCLAVTGACGCDRVFALTRDLCIHSVFALILLTRFPHKDGMYLKDTGRAVMERVGSHEESLDVS